MVRVCAWCERYLGVKESPGTEAAVTHGICATCLHTKEWAADAPTLVVSRTREDLAPVLQALLRPADLRVVVDRRRGERRQRPSGAEVEPERRRGPDRRRALLAAVV